ncbi:MULTISPECIES: isoleucine--tRNA ligase [Streptomyces]|uniref:Isoleucine--tRNA ligase n=1 Tax=Streptomyces tsukubensis (strain DSM 42081 / NBRC 108919 / NRRL 18488 / 9993) TaxID=1114943 RepID=I2MWT2_STRT9|nr:MULTISPECIES: isoleucine--tRNA ligase [Streptomyces]AZK93642.1 isoleucine--tRNA ligase [Streptomyces tsukubensis]EIF89229.1 isoleucyl-tRNA synthetase [Streptomyces tsukubensis NRRL18488]MYS64703.1 isoleucine--tRNA ligase [Streptomyces sp. SID5473]QKM70212.1 isoleucine--tRNA ligase [Streptomyces tsukubensis NRRL18488]TAI45808.1 isoleucine--tRNA ligase [Streptomyces tsukubensis]
MTPPQYRPVPAQVDLPALEHAVLDFWRENKVFAQSLARSEGRPEWVFYEGPPTANGMPGAHHIEARVFKDVFPRFRTMRGYHVARKAGWDCHGLPVELAVEKELGFSGKQDIEAYGIAEFNAKCRESVTRHTDAFAELTERMGYWVDLDDAYWTMKPEYIDSVWWSLKQIFDKGLLVQDHRVAPWCPRCGTGLSDHELAQGYETVVDPSVYVRFPLTSGPLAGEASLLVWTTTPWTLVSNTAVAAHPDVTYTVATDGTEKVVVAEPLLAKALGEGWEPTGQSFTGAEMERWTYRRPFDLVEFPAPAHFVVNADYVTTEDGTGLVHQSPAFGEDDLKVCRAYGLPVVNPVRPDGTFEEDLPLVGGVFFKKADETLTADLGARGLLFRHLPYEHSYPHCWRCHTALLYYAQPSWYIRTTAVKDRLIEENENTNWFPDSVKHGRFGDWLNNNIDWALSRNRYWGTPLPIWRCEEGHLTCVGSRAELSELTGSDQSELDPHRPFIDDVTFDCPQCAGTATRVPEVIDAWYDAGSMPFAQWGYPYHNKELFEKRYPAQFISEAIDQTRGWFYTLMAVGTLVFDKSSYENVVCLGHILAEDGRKMSKHLGNILQPIPLMDQHGADAVRWFMAAGGSPWSARRVGHSTIQEVVRKTLLTYWNTVAFQALYARTAGWAPSAADPAPADRPVLDRWLLGELNTLIEQVTDAMEGYDTQRAGKLLSSFVDDLSNWYVRRSRRRFWQGDAAALRTLHEVVETVTRLMAPLTPFITERVWQDLVVPVTPGAPGSVHLTDWPEADGSAVDPELSRQMVLVRRLVELGRATRAESGVKTRQPLSRALVAATGFEALSPELHAQITEELNVSSLASLAEVGGSLVDTTAKANFRALGKRFGKGVQAVARAVAETDAAALALALRGGEATLEVEGETITLTPDEVFITETPREGWSVASDSGATVALDLEITPELRLAGLARDAIRLIQEARKNSGLDVADRIAVVWTSPQDETVRALDEHAALIADEVLATSFAGAAPDASYGPAFTDESLGLTFHLRKV